MTATSAAIYRPIETGLIDIFVFNGFAVDGYRQYARDLSSLLRNGWAKATGRAADKAEKICTRYLPQALGCNTGRRRNMHEWYVAQLDLDGGYLVSRFYDDYLAIGGLGGTHLTKSEPIAHFFRRKDAVEFLQQKEKEARAACEEMGIRFEGPIRPWNHVGRINNAPIKKPA